MKHFLLSAMAGLFTLSCCGQKPRTGSYIFKYCDLEYNNCISTCQVLVKGGSIIIYATGELSKTITHTKKGDILAIGIILKHKSGQWIIGKSLQDKYVREIGGEGLPIIDFRKKQYWTF